jgi:TPR repeat protein
MIPALVLAAGLLVSSAAGADEPTASPAYAEAKARLVAGDPAGKPALEALAAAGDPDAQTLVASASFVGGGGFSIDKARSCALWEQASKARALAAHLHAECVERGYDGRPRDPTAARGLYKAVADRGFSKSKCALGNLLILGQGGPADPERGLALCREAAQAGDADAQTDVGDYYLRGKIVPRDVGEARTWYEKAVAQGQKNAHMTLGQIYWNGDGVPKDNARAAALWRVAYAKGRLDADQFLADEAFVRANAVKGQINVAAMDEAIDWYQKALARDPSLSEKLRPRLDLLLKIKAARS